jgi:hypothetical protein
VRFESTGFRWNGFSRDEEFEIGFIGRRSIAPFYRLELVAAMSVVVRYGKHGAAVAESSEQIEWVLEGFDLSRDEEIENGFWRHGSTARFFSLEWVIATRLVV